MADRVSNTDLPGVKSIIEYMKAEGVETPEQLIAAAAEHMGFVSLSDETVEQLIENAQSTGNLDWSDEDTAGRRIGETMALIGATTEYQFG